MHTYHFELKDGGEIMKDMRKFEKNILINNKHEKDLDNIKFVFSKKLSDIQKLSSLVI
jgi:hypothetical protein